MDPQFEANKNLEAAYSMLASINQDLEDLLGLLDNIREETGVERVLVADKASGHITIRVM